MLLSQSIWRNLILLNSVAKLRHFSKCQYLRNKTMGRQIDIFVVAAVSNVILSWSWFLPSKTKLPEGCGQDPCDTFTNQCFARFFFQQNWWHKSVCANSVLNSFMFGFPETVSSGMISCLAFLMCSNSFANSFIFGFIQLVNSLFFIYLQFFFVLLSVSFFLHSSKDP